jgi:hypothetical protein
MREPVRIAEHCPSDAVCIVGLAQEQPSDPAADPSSGDLAARPDTDTPIQTDSSYYDSYGGPTEAPGTGGYYYDGGGSAELLLFPYCRCVDYRCASSPWKMVPQTIKATNDASVSQICFKFVFVGCAISSTCCNQLTRDVAKVEFAVGK